MENASIKIVFHTEQTKFVLHAQLAPKLMPMEIANSQILTVSLSKTENAMPVFKDTIKALLAAVSDFLLTVNSETSLLKVHALNATMASTSKQTAHVLKLQKDCNFLTAQSCRVTYAKHVSQAFLSKTGLAAQFPDFA